MKAIFCADVHAHKWASFSQPVSTYGNSRLGDTIRALSRMSDYALEHQISLIVLVGDLFHTRATVSTQVLSLISDILKVFRNRGQVVHIVAGNHDQADKSGEFTALDTLDKVACIHTKPELSESGLIAFIPYSENVEETKASILYSAAHGAKILTYHGSVDGAFVAPSEYQPKHSLKPADLLLDHFEQVWLGHYHEPQMIAPNAIYCGGFVAHTFSDLTDRGFWVTETGKQPLFVSSGAPRFIVEEINTKKELLGVLNNIEDNNFYKLRVNADIVLPDLGYNVLVEKVIDKKMDIPRIQNLHQLSNRCLIETYVKHKGIYDLNLINRGIELFGG